jgi:hypothetical protein
MSDDSGFARTCIHLIFQLASWLPFSFYWPAAALLNSKLKTQNSKLAMPAPHEIGLPRNFVWGHSELAEESIKTTREAFRN